MKTLIQKPENHQNEKGSALIIAYVISTVVFILGGSLVLNSIWNYRYVQREKDDMTAYYVAEGGFNYAKQTIFQAFQTATGGTTLSFSWFSDWCSVRTDTNNNGVLDENDACTVPDSKNLPTLERLQIDGAIPNAIFSVQILDTDTSNLEYADVKIKVCSKVGGNTNLDPCVDTDPNARARRSMTGEMRFNLGQSPVFDYGYFINNFGYWWGGPLNANTDMRANGDFELNYQPNVNGDVYAAPNDELGAPGEINCNRNPCTNYDSLEAYLDDLNTPLEARPGSPSALGGEEGQYEVDGGYSGEPIFQEDPEPISMPYLGNISFYQSYASAKNGTLSFNDAWTGEPEVVNANYDGVLVLIGTDADPIQINGPVVSTGDVIIKGKVTGQGTIYSGRNVHIIGDIEYVDGPGWSKPDTDPEGTAATNSTKNFLGLAAKGNVVVGDYTDNTHRSWMTSLLSPNGSYSITHKYTIDASDSSLGYNNCTGGCIPNGGNPDALWFDGDYTAEDGYVREDDSPRRFYESTLVDADFDLLSPTNAIDRIDAVAYTNHVYAGLMFDSAPAINGGFVSRDDGMVVYSGFTLNYDIRVKSNPYDFYLPRTILFPDTLVWDEPVF
ncbi:MAG: hypothetical protein COV74_06250 [Candidatus Omnitrophica bacterium CG11_big_fil_rev_8_21_14_0_20_45_26]|uniref:Type 4 fimbrial biogenesis protein PilX N-terminal domain-containing protein n=1 Tax=Candidatus Abzuiibacterium crystallinum TaxID=1974748 RepID=A0A2H0LNL9_9BACT|nr:MAG: hypothetical protein COV74_06250 [Candidatus Omnitrophica bacterium CG11_big_fil_rev_8_21_14_0_20_45_26]PIW65645.1 MAG: hypothetical protein COW12_00630 [Candidatus Omnitrophica bacterium CG12_big_fil_rev_8_21_14_0_65_45_16]